MSIKKLVLRLGKSLPSPRQKAARAILNFWGYALKAPVCKIFAPRLARRGAAAYPSITIPS
jgi:hypothetical protein